MHDTEYYIINPMQLLMQSTSFPQDNLKVVLRCSYFDQILKHTHFPTHTERFVTNFPFYFACSNNEKYRGHRCFDEQINPIQRQHNCRTSPFLVSSIDSQLANGEVCLY